MQVAEQVNGETDAKPVVVVAGPTASGKSAAAMSMASAFDGVVINADSMQIYRELAILTARPSAVDMRRIPHRLYGVRSVTDPCSAARWRELAVQEISDAWALNKLPIICGGTGLYLSALIEGLSPVPDVPDEIRRAVRSRWWSDGPSAVRAALVRADPVLAAQLPPADRQRTLRALEVYEATGRPLSSWQSEPKSGPPAGYRFCSIGFLPPRDLLYAACDARLARMVEEGALDEVAALKNTGVDPALPAMKALGVPHFLAYLEGKLDMPTALQLAQTATRRYAKRQFTWFRNHFISEFTIKMKYNYENDREIFPFIRQKLLTGQS